MTTPFTGEKSLLRLYVWLVVLVTLLTLAVGAVLALHRPASFSTAAKVELMPVATRGAPIAPDMATERELAGSGSVAEDAATRLGTTAEAAVPGPLGLGGDRRDGSRDRLLRRHPPTRLRRRRRLRAQLPGGAQRTAERARGDDDHQAGRTRSSAATDYALVLTVALVCGLGLGLAAAWLWDRLSDRVRSSHELERAGRPVVAEVSRCRAAASGSRPAAVRTSATSPAGSTP